MVGDTLEDGDNVPLLALPPYDYRIARCFFSNNLTSPANDSEKVCWGENLIGGYVECEDLKTPMDTTSLLAAIKFQVMRILG